jgi:hypothetical protein
MVNTDMPGAGTGANEALLRSEIGFWREMIDSCDDTQPEDSVERMHHALELAEARLMHLFEFYRQAGANDSDGPSNVYYLVDKRSKLK